MPEANLFYVHLTRATETAQGHVCLGELESHYLTRDDALNLAAWITALCDPGLERLPGMVEEVLGS